MIFGGVGNSIATFIGALILFGILYAIINTINSKLGFYAGMGICFLNVISSFITWDPATYGVDQLIVADLTTVYFGYLFYKKAFPDNSTSMSGGKRR